MARFSWTSWFKRRKRRVVGLDIGNYAVKVVQIEHSQNKRLLSYSLLPQAEEGLNNSIKQALKEAGIEGEFVNISLSGQATLTRNILFPKMSQAEMKQALKFEAEKYIPFPLKEVAIDARILEPDIEDGKKMEVLLAAAKKELLLSRIDLLKELGFHPLIVDIDCLALINTFIQSPYFSKDLRSFALINLGASVSNLCILEQGHPRLTRDLLLGGRDLTRRLSDTLGIETSQAEKLKRNPGNRQEEIMQVLESMLEHLASELRLSFDYYESQSQIVVEKVYISGGGSRLEGIEEMLTNLLGIKTELWNPLAGLEIKDGLDRERLNEISPQLTIAVGLALR